MPYITEAAKLHLQSCNPDGSEAFARVSGELNYQITMLLKTYWDNHGPNYQAINDIVGATAGALAEFQRRVVVDYENKKITENGDCY